MITSVRRPCITPLRRLFSTCNYQCKTHRMLTVNPRFCIFQEAFRACPKPENFTRLLSDSVPSSPSHLPSLSRGSDPGSCGFPLVLRSPLCLCTLYSGTWTSDYGWLVRSTCWVLVGFWSVVETTSFAFRFLHLGVRTSRLHRPSLYTLPQRSRPT